MKFIEQFIRKKILKRNNPQSTENKCFRTNKKFTEKYPNHTIGIGTYGLPLVHDWDEGSNLSIGSFGSIASNVQIFLGGHHRADWVTTFPFPALLPNSNIKDYGGTNGDVTIGSDVWICANVIILSGATVGHGAVLANGAVITKDVEPYSIVGGNPANFIKYRFDENTRQRLLSTQWWNLPEDTISQNIHKMCTTDTDTFLEFIENL